MSELNICINDMSFNEASDEFRHKLNKLQLKVSKLTEAYDKLLLFWRWEVSFRKRLGFAT